MARTMMVSSALAAMALLLLGTAMAAAPLPPAVPDDQYTVEVCPNAEWKGALFIKPHSAQGTLDNITDWTMTEIIDYAKADLFPAAYASLAFLAMAILTLAILIAWRLIRMCCTICCCRASCKENAEKANPAELLNSRNMKIFKFVMLLFVITGISLSIAGAAKQEKEIFDDMWLVVDDFTNYFANVTDSIDSVVNATKALKPILRSLATSLVPYAIFDPTGNVLKTVQSIGTAANSVDSIVANFAASGQNLRENLVDLLKDKEVQYSSTTKTIDKDRYVALVVIFCAGIIIGLLLTGFVLINCQFGITFALICSLVVIIVWFIITAAVALSTQGVSEVCYHFERVAITMVPSDLSTLTEYYFFGPADKSVKKVLNDSGIIDADKAISLATNQTADISLKLNASFVALNQTPSAAVLNTTAAMNNQSNLIAVNINATIAMADYDHVHPLWVETKGFLCCKLPDSIAGAWNIMTFDGWVFMVLCWLVMYYLSRVDKLPTGCCGWACIFPGRAAQVHPAGEDAPVSAIAIKSMDPEAGKVNAYTPPAPAVIAAGAGFGAVVVPVVTGAGGEPEPQWPIDANTGMPLPMDPDTQYPINPETGRPFDPATGQTVELAMLQQPDMVADEV